MTITTPLSQQPIFFVLRQRTAPIPHGFWCERERSYGRASGASTGGSRYPASSRPQIHRLRKPPLPTASILGSGAAHGSAPSAVFGLFMKSKADRCADCASRKKSSGRIDLHLNRRVPIFLLLVDAQGHGLISAKIASTVHDTFHALMLVELDHAGIFEKINLRLAQSQRQCARNRHHAL